MENVPRTRAPVGRIFQQALPATDVRETAETYSHLFDDTAGEARKADAAAMVNAFYDLATGFYEYGWGQSFHFGPIGRGETREASIVRQRALRCTSTGTQEGATSAGYGVRHWRANAQHRPAFRRQHRRSEYQASTSFGRARKKYTQEQAPGVRSVRSSRAISRRCLSKRRRSTRRTTSKRRATRRTVPMFSEKRFACVQAGLPARGLRGNWCLTDQYDATNAFHRQTKWGIEKGNALPELIHTSEIVNALTRSGFEVVDTHDRAGTSDPGSPWYSPLGASVSLKGFLQSTVGTTVTHGLVKTLEALHLSPKGTTVAHDVLRLAQTALVDGGRLGIFTPMFFFLARKPEAKRGKNAERR